MMKFTAELYLNNTFFEKIKKYNEEIMLISKFKNTNSQFCDWTIYINLMYIDKKQGCYISKVRFLFEDRMPKELLKNGNKFKLFYIMYEVGYGILKFI